MPAAIVRDFLAPGTEFHIGKIEMVANTATYGDSPFHGCTDGVDLSRLPPRITGGAGARRGAACRARIERGGFRDLDLRGKEVFVDSGWYRHWAPVRAWPWQVSIR
ncbi:MAG TPA: hypothetical protein VMR62_34500 [Bryobacteraceae bacterium]|nr:hypothetical protein [Bryobacteraceae bacterium]